MRYQEMILAVTLVIGFVVAEVPQNVRNYTETSSRYSLEQYGSGIASQSSNIDDEPVSVNG